MSGPLPRWLRLWLPLVVLAVGGAAGVATVLGGEPEPVGVDTGHIPAESRGRDGVLSFEVRSAECGFENVIAEERVPAEGQFCLVELTVGAAVSGTTARLNLDCQYLITRDGERFLVHEESTLAGVDPGPFRSGIRPGSRRMLELTFDVPTDAEAVGLELHSSCDSDGLRLAFAGSDPLRG